MGQFHLRRAAGDDRPPAEIHRPDILDSLPPEPLGDLPVAVDRGPGPPRDRDEIADMIGVAVRHEDRIAGDLRPLHAGRWGFVEERVDEEDAVAGVYEPGGMSDPSQRDRHRVLLRRVAG